jgi:lipopolysaccharide/colanic/teichoic acid biosynthesis glycosyltransferase
MVFAEHGRPTRDLQLLAKRAIDIVTSGLALLILSPLFLLTSLAIQVESGRPIFIVRHEYCYNNRHIRALRFRTRSHHTETLVGRFLIRRGLDRLPMLINVLRGEMSIVGPHCHSAVPSIALSDQQSLTLSNGQFRPGLVSFENPERARSQLEADLFYIANWSLLLDVKTLFRNFSNLTSQ